MNAEALLGFAQGLFCLETLGLVLGLLVSVTFVVVLKSLTIVRGEFSAGG